MDVLGARFVSLSQVDDKFASNFVPYRRVISCYSDLDSLHLAGRLSLVHLSL